MDSNIRILGAASLFVAASLGACSSDSDSHEESEGVATESTCPPGSDLTYESFGRGFMESYCTRCHSSALSGAGRNEAPAGHDFDTIDGILAVVEHIDEYAAAGPAGVNTAMPPTGPTPNADERRLLGQWLACETVSGAGDGGTHD